MLASLATAAGLSAVLAASDQTRCVALGNQTSVLFPGVVMSVYAARTYPGAYHILPATIIG